jgi:hypothetical protein
MTTFTREQHELIAFIRGFLSDPAHDESSSNSMTAKAFRVALAAMQQEPVAWVLSNRPGNDTSTIDRAFPVGTQLYAAPPAPIALPVQNWEELCRQNPDMSIGDAIIRAAWWNHCAAMLQGKAEPVSNRDELPLDYLQGHKNGLEWAVQLAETNHPQTGDWLYDDPIELAKAIRKGPDMPAVEAGNSPVIQDGWISCSERMPPQGEPLLICSSGGVVQRTVYGFDGKNWLDWYELYEPVKAEHCDLWQPLPAAPQQ